MKVPEKRPGPLPSCAEWPSQLKTLSVHSPSTHSDMMVAIEVARQAKRVHANWMGHNRENFLLVALQLFLVWDHRQLRMLENSTTHHCRTLGWPADAGDILLPIFAIAPSVHAVERRYLRTERPFLESRIRGALGRVSLALVARESRRRGCTLRLDQIRNMIGIGHYRKGFVPAHH